MSGSRDRILQRLRRLRPGLPEQPPAAGKARQPRSPEGRKQRFRELLEAVRAEVHPCGRDQWPVLLQRLARKKGVGTLLYGAGGPLAAALEASWDGSGAGPRLVAHAGPFEQWKEAIFDQADAAVTSARWGIAETGTLVLWPTPEEPRTLSLVPPTHFVVLDAADLHDDFAGLVAAERWRDGMPSNALLISGPSKTADIEQTLSYGIHGPVELVVLLLE